LSWDHQRPQAEHHLGFRGGVYRGARGVDPGPRAGAALQYWLGLKLGIFPIAFFESWWHSVLPSIVLATVISAVVATYMRTEMLEVMSQDYVTLAKAKGLSRLAVVLRHVLRNSLIPIVTILVPLTAALVTGTLIVETVFSIPASASSSCVRSSIPTTRLSWAPPCSSRSSSSPLICYRTSSTG
jgi:hypothetical protein